MKTARESKSVVRRKRATPPNEAAGERPLPWEKKGSVITEVKGSWARKLAQAESPRCCAGPPSQKAPDLETSAQKE